SGDKHWRVYGAPVMLPLRGQAFDASSDQSGPPILEFELQAGDTLYIPRGYVHEAQSSSTVSLHITAGVMAFTSTDLVLEALASTCLLGVSLRRALPIGFAHQTFDRTGARYEFRRMLQAFVESADFDAILDRFIEEFLSTRQLCARGYFLELERID